MKGSKNFPKVSPQQFAKARDTVRIVKKKSTMKPIEFRNLNYDYIIGCDPASGSDSTIISKIVDGKIIEVIKK